ncbi:DJ-1/PfpI family protein [Pararhizobium mangrovi]|uniref:DJ-1/PfpI family protein n=1 Tax=Pararhizobium mangrovi TaxID=2590452 RepID=A0A506U736_9HYPH|nr:DJ-1/PfpI family protein [Pararhizobium mangrovi]TPW27697.1 DJ-1/PfpI family protein [Pararhizobium mangrovi]
MTDPIDRRTLMALTALGSLAAAIPAAAQDETEAQHMKRMKAIPRDAPKIAMLVYPKMVALDLIEPMTILTILRSNIHLVWKDKQPVSTDVHLPIAATHTFDDVPDDLDVLFVPGGILGTIDCMTDPEVLAFLADRGQRAKWVTSVCTGGLVLAAAGLLNGYDATAHWAVADLLPLMGARHVDERVVTDRNRMTGGGVTAGLDFGLDLAAKLRDEDAARRIQLILEYSPEPPFHNGTPAEAGPDRLAKARASRQWMDGEARKAAMEAGKRLGTI